MDSDSAPSTARIFILQPSSGVPIYRQLINQVKRMVASGQLVPGTALPSVREVATQYTVNPTTISKAYGMLESEGLLRRNRGKHMTIAESRRNQGSLIQRFKQVEPQIDALILAARQLELREADLIGLIKKRMGEDS